jgi:hypothetical protein
MYATDIIMMLALFAGCKTGNEVAAVNKHDTTVILKKDTAFAAGIAPLIMPFTFSKDKVQLLKSSKNILLLLNKPKLTTAPEGVYEVYLTNTLQDIDKLSASQKSFVSLLDLYSFTAPGAKQQIEIEVSNKIAALTPNHSSPFFIIIRFEPIKAGSETASSRAGEISFSGFSIIGVNE